MGHFLDRRPLVLAHRARPHATAQFGDWAKAPTRIRFGDRPRRSDFRFWPNHLQDPQGPFHLADHLVESRSILQYTHARCQLPPAQTGDLHPFPSGPAGAPTPSFESVFEYSEGPVPLVLGEGQEVEHTASRRSGPRWWLRAVVWLIAAGLHPRAGVTTQAVADDLAKRMDYDLGHVRYCLDGTAVRLGVSRATVKRHVAVLRELGALAWVEHGTRLNVRRLLGHKGYAGTATVYAAVIPPVYDRAMGHHLEGAGYSAKVAHERPVPVDNSPVDNCGEPPSLNVVKEVGQVEVDGGWYYTSRQGASRKSPSIPRQTRGEKRTRRDGGTRRSPARVAQDCRIAAQVRPLVTWTQAERSVRRLAFALRPLIDRGLEAHDIAAELNAWALSWRPKRPAAFIRDQVARQDAYAAALGAATAPLDNEEWRQWVEAREREQAVMAVLCAARPRTDADRQEAREAAWHDPRIVAGHIEDRGVDDALDLYGARLVSLAERMAASGVQFTARW